MNEQRTKFWEKFYDHQERLDERYLLVQSSNEIQESLMGNQISMEFIHPIMEQFFEAAKEAYFEEYPKRRKFHLKRIREDLPEQFDRLVGQYKERAQDRLEELSTDISTISHQLQEIASEIQLKPGEQWNQHDAVPVSVYSSQGHGAKRYAEASANLKALKAEQEGLPTKVKKDGKSFVVLVKASEMELDILRHKPNITNEQMIRYCKNNNVNPKVFNPFLSQGTVDSV